MERSRRITEGLGSFELKKDVVHLVHVVERNHIWTAYSFSLLLCIRPSVNHTLNPEKKKAFVIWGKSHSHNFTCDTAVSTECSQRGNRRRIKGFNWSESQQGSANDSIPQRVFVTALHCAGSKIPLNSNSSQREEREVEVLRVQTKTLWKALLPFSITLW